MPPRFGGAPKCPRCEKSVYMAEQVIGPGGPWHNYCLTCKECNKRLDSTTLTEKDNEAYCKTCYGRKWGPKGYGFAGGAAFLSTETKMPSEILKNNFYDDQNITRAPSLPSREAPTLPKREIIPESQSPRLNQQTAPSLPSRPILPNRPPAHQNHSPETTSETASNDMNSNSNHASGGYIRNHTSYVPRKFNFQAQQDICSGCGKVVYAAELVLGAGNKYHKMCLKCCQCGKRLDSTNMVDRDYDLYCRGCYSKSFGPKGYGYGNLLTPEGSTR